MLRTNEMLLVASQDDCAIDAYEYFEKELKQKGIPSVSDFHAIGKKYEEDDGFYTQYHLPLCSDNRSRSPVVRGLFR